MFKGISISVILSGFAFTATAQNYEVRNDQQLWFAVEQMSTGLGTGCQLGDPTGCQYYQYVQDMAAYLVALNDGCLYQGDQLACQHFQEAYGQMDASYGAYIQNYAPRIQAMMANSGGQTQLYNPMGATHNERMENISNWGNQMLQNGRDHSARMDANHNAFIESIWE